MNGNPQQKYLIKDILQPDLLAICATIKFGAAAISVAFALIATPRASVQARGFIGTPSPGLFAISYIRGINAAGENGHISKYYVNL